MNEQMVDVSQWKPTLAEYQQLHQRDWHSIDLEN
jgi:hypothetical protein